MKVAISIRFYSSSAISAGESSLIGELGYFLRNSFNGSSCSFSFSFRATFCVLVGDNSIRVDVKDGAFSPPIKALA